MNSIPERTTDTRADRNIPNKHSTLAVRSRCLRSVTSAGLVLVLGLRVSAAAATAPAGQTFATPGEAVSALVLATTSQNPEALRTLFGPATSELENPDSVQRTNELKAFTAALTQTNRLVHESDIRCVLEVGPNSWPFPIPIVKRDNRWFFDTLAGKEELLTRRIGKNELATLEVLRAYVAAQGEYACRDHDGDQVLEYAQKLRSSPGTQDGLYWPPGPDGEISPLGPLVAQAQEEGYNVKARAANAAPDPFHGYFFKILTRQGRHAPGGKYDYIINGNMIGGFALVAWPAAYGQSGIMTFIVNQQGRVYQKDLGPKTDKLARDLKAYDPDPTWQVSRD